MKSAIRRVLTSRYFYMPAAGLLLYTLIGFIFAPLIVRWVVPKYARDSLNCQAALSEVRMNPFLLTFEARGFELKQAEGSPLVSFERFFADMELKSLFRWAAIFRELSLEKPTVHAIVEADGGLNLRALIPPAQEPPEPEKPDSGPFRMLIENIAVLGGKVVVIDRRQSQPAELIVEMFDLCLKDLSTLQDRNGTYALTTSTPLGEKFEWQGAIALAPFRSSGKIAVEGLKTATLWEFVRDALNIESPGGIIDVTTEYRFDVSGSTTQFLLESARLALSDLSLKLVDAPGPFLAWDRFELDVPRVDLVEKDLQIKKVLLDGCALDLRLDPAGRMNLRQIAREIPAKPEQEATPAPESRAEPPPEEPNAPAEAGPPFKMMAEAVEIKGMSIAFEDASPTTPSKGGCSSIDLHFSASMGTVAEEADTAVDGEPNEKRSTPPGFAVDGLGFSLADLYLKGAGLDKPIIEVKKLELDVPHLNLMDKTVQLTKLLVDGGAVDVRMDSSGLTNLERIAREVARGQSGEKRSEPSEVAAGESTPDEVAGSDDRPFNIDAESIEIKGVAFDFNDSSRAAPLEARCSEVGLHLKASIQAGGAEPRGTISGISSEIKEIQVSDAQSPEPLFRTGRLTIEGGECNLGARSIVVPRIALSDGHLDVSRDAEGRINWLRLVAAKDEARESAASGGPAESKPSWDFLVKSIELEGFRSRLSDLGARPDQSLFDVQGFSARISDLDGKSPMGFAVDFQVEQGGRVSLSGRVDPKVPSVEARVNVADFALTPLQPYLEPYVTLVMRSAAVSTEGRLAYGVPGGAAGLVYDGSFKLSKLNLTEAGSEQTYLGLGALQAPKLNLTLQPDRFEAGDVKLSGLVGELIIAEDGTVNLTRVLKQQEGGEKPPAAPPRKPGEEKEGFPFRVGRIQVEDGNVLFADLSLMPKFNVRIHQLKGVVTGLSSSRDSRARIQLEGRVDRFGLARINGVIQLYDFQRSTEIDMVFRNVEMTALTPYSGKFAGRQIKSGRLSTDFKYRIQNRKLVGDNKIILDNLVLGDRVDSPDAVNLPLDLAIALLKDSNGRIDIGLPVTGDLDNPEFSIGPLIWKALVGFLTRAVTAPFRALGSMFGGQGEELNAVDFDPGSKEIPPPEREKLQKLAEALLKRPQLALVLQGRYSPEADGTELRDLSVRRTVAARLGSELKPEEDPGPLDLTDSRVRKQLEALFEERFGEQALRELDRNIKSGAVQPRMPEVRQPDETKGRKKGFLSRMANNLKLYKVVPGGKSPEEAALWSGELYLRLVESEPMPEEVLIKLADDRARAIAAELESEGKVPGDRVRIEKPEALTDDAAPGVKLSLGAL